MHTVPASDRRSITRRLLVRQFVFGTAASFIGGLWRTERVLAADIPFSSTGTLVVQLSQFPVLQSAGGAVRLDMGIEYPVAINRGAGNTFYAMSTKCQHNGCTVNNYDSATQLIRCSCHGSTYTISGALAGGPAARGLDPYSISFDGVNTLRVTVPGPSYAARRIVVESVGVNTRRLRLDFMPVPFQRYQVLYKPTASAASQVASFSLTASGVANQTTYQANLSSPATLSVWVDAPGDQGYFSIANVVTEYTG